VCPNLSEDADKKRFSVTLTTAYVKALDSLVGKGIYTDNQAAIRDAMRILFRHHGIEPFRSNLVEEAEKVQE